MNRLAERVSLVGPTLLLLALWSAVSMRASGSVSAVPHPWIVADELLRNGSFYAFQTAQTLAEGGVGYVTGSILALGVASALALAPPVDPIAKRAFLFIYCLPIMATAPIVLAIFPGPWAAAAIAAQAAFSVSFLTINEGLRIADAGIYDVVRASGARRSAILRRVRLPGALPEMVLASKASAPAALVGAVIAEFIGADRGLGVTMLASLQTFNVVRVWAAAVILTGLAATASAAFNFLGRIVENAGFKAQAGQPVIFRGSTANQSLASAVADNTLALGAVIVLWWAGIRLLNLDPLFAKSPADVLAYLSSGSLSGLTAIWPDLRTTLADASMAFLVGLAAALTLGAIASLARPVEHLLVSLAIVLRSIPLTASGPLIVLITGRGLACVLVVAGTQTFLPALLGVLHGLRSAPAAGIEMADSLGAGPLSVLIKVRLPYGIPMLSVAGRLAAPTALMGALLAEWLATGKGLGYRMLVAAGESDYALVWTSVVLSASVAFLLYLVVEVGEARFLWRERGYAAAPPA